jgi:hypothetical protein
LSILEFEGSRQADLSKMLKSYSMIGKQVQELAERVSVDIRSLTEKVSG